MAWLWVKKQLANIPSVGWLLAREFISDTTMEAIRAFFLQWNVTMWLWNYVLSHPVYIVLGVFIVIFIWAYIDKTRIGKKQIEVKPATRKRQADWDRTEHLMLAELQVKNVTPTELQDVQVSVTNCLTLQEKQDSANQNEYAMWNQQNIQPFNVYWSKRQTQPEQKQISMGIPGSATRSALIAFQDNPNGGAFNFNSLNNEWIVGGVKISVEISSHKIVLWKGEFYIECHPNYAISEFPYRIDSKFELTEWNVWAKDKNVTLLTLGRGDSQPRLS